MNQLRRTALLIATCLAIAGACRIGTDAVSVKATTNERMGFVGREEGIAALAIATIMREERG